MNQSIYMKNVLILKVAVQRNKLLRAFSDIVTYFILKLHVFFFNLKEN